MAWVIAVILGVCGMVFEEWNAYQYAVVICLIVIALKQD